MKKKLSITAGLTISAALLYLACRQVNFRALAEILRGVRPAPLALILLTVLAELAIRGIKWSLLLGPAGKVRTWDALRLETAGLALNNVLPLRLGELARGAFGAELFKMSLVTVFSTILAEKALDMAALFTLSAAAARISGITGGIPWRGLLLAVTITAAAAAFLFYKNTGRLSSYIGKFPALKKTLGSLTLGLKAFKSPAAAAAIFSLALLQWFMNALNYYWLALAFDIGKTVGISKSVLLSFTGAAASSAPGMPGYFGSIELAVSTVMSAWGINQEAALAYAAASHIFSYLIVTAAGLFFVYQMGQSLGNIWSKFSEQSARESETAAGAQP